MIFRESSNSAVPKLALKRIEAAQGIGVSLAALDQLALRVLLHPSYGVRRPLSGVKEIERFPNVGA